MKYISQKLILCLIIVFIINSTIVGSVTLLNYTQAQIEDFTPPVIEIFNPTSATTSGKITVRVKYNDPSGLNKTRYCWTQQENCDPKLLATGDDFINDINIQQSNIGNWRLCTAARDNANNWSNVECHGPYIKQTTAQALVLVLPENNAVNIPVADLSLSWLPINGAEAYLVTMYGRIGSNSNQIPIIKDDLVTNTNIVINSNLLMPNARYEWTVTARLPGDSVLMSAPSVFFTVLIPNAELVPLSNPGLTPASPFYFLDRTGEWLRNTFLTWGNNSRVDRALSRAQERLSELAELAISNRLRSTYLNKIQINYSRAITQAHLVIEEISNPEQRALEFSRLANLSERARVVMGGALSRVSNQLVGVEEVANNMISNSARESCDSLIKVQSNRSWCGMALDSYANNKVHIINLVQDTKNVLENTRSYLILRKNILARLVNDFESSNGYVSSLGRLSEKLSIQDDTSAQAIISDLRIKSAARQQLEENLTQLNEFSRTDSASYKPFLDSSLAQAAGFTTTSNLDYLSDLGVVLANSTTTQTAALQLAQKQVDRTVSGLNNELEQFNRAIEANTVVRDFDRLQSSFVALRQTTTDGDVPGINNLINQIGDNQVINRTEFSELRNLVSELVNTMSQYANCAMGGSTSTATQVSNQLTRTVGRLEQTRAQLEQIRRTYLATDLEPINDRMQKLSSLKDDLTEISSVISSGTVEQVRQVLGQKLRINIRSTTSVPRKNSLALGALPVFAYSATDNFINIETARIASVFTLNPRLSPDDNQNNLRTQLRQTLRDEVERERNYITRTLSQANSLISSRGKLEETATTLQRSVFAALLDQIQQLVEQGRYEAARNSAEQFSNLVAGLTTSSLFDNLRVRALELVVSLQAATANPQIRLFERLSEFKQFAQTPGKCENSNEAVSRVDDLMSNFNAGSTSEEFVAFCLSANTAFTCAQSALPNNAPVNPASEPTPPDQLRQLRIIKTQP